METENENGERELNSYYIKAGSLTAGGLITADSEGMLITPGITQDDLISSAYNVYYSAIYYQMFGNFSADKQVTFTYNYDNYYGRDLTSYSQIDPSSSIVVLEGDLTHIDYGSYYLAQVAGLFRITLSAYSKIDAINNDNQWAPGVNYFMQIMINGIVFMTSPLLRNVSDDDGHYSFMCQTIRPISINDQISFNFVVNGGAANPLVVFNYIDLSIELLYLT